MITLDQPLALLLLLPWTLLVAWVALRQRSALAWLRPRVSARGLARLTAYARLPWPAHMLLVWSAGAAAIGAAAGPYSVAAGEVTRQTTDVLLILDASLSMECGDAHPHPSGEALPSRLAAAKRFAHDLIELLPAARFGLLSFSGEVIVHAPITTDRHALRTQLDALTWHRSEHTSGSELGRALGGVVRLWRHQEDAVQVVLLSDGDVTANPEPFDDALAAVQALGVPVHTVALGSEEGETRSIYDPADAALPKDMRRKLVEFTSKRDTDTLARISAATGGTAVVAGQGWVELLLLPMERARPHAVALTQPVRRDHSRLLVGLMLVLLFAEALLTRRAAALLLLLPLTGCTESWRAAHRLNEQGRSEVRAELWEDAALSFEQSAALQVRPHIPTRNLALVRHAQARRAEAHELLERAMVLEPAFTQARYDDGVVLYAWGASELDVEGCQLERTRELWTLAESRFAQAQAEGPPDLRLQAGRNREVVAAELVRLTEVELSACGGGSSDPEEQGGGTDGAPGGAGEEPGDAGGAGPDDGQEGQGGAASLTPEEQAQLEAALQRARAATSENASGWRQTREQQGTGHGEHIRW